MTTTEKPPDTTTRWYRKLPGPFNHKNGAHEDTPPEEPTIPDLKSLFNFAWLDDDGPVRHDGTKLSILEIDGVEVTTSALGAYAGLLNATNFPIQILVRQHAPQMESMVEDMIARRPDYLTEKVQEAADSLDELLLGLEQREGLVDRRFYVICDQANIELLAGGIASLRDVGLLPLRGERLKKFLASLAIGSSPATVDFDKELTLNVHSKFLQMGDRHRSTMVLSKWPRAITPTYLPSLLSLGIPLDLSIYISPIPQADATRKLEWQKTKMDSDRAMKIRRGQAVRPETEIALQDIDRLRDQVQRGVERLFDAAVIVTVHGTTSKQLDSNVESISRHFTSSLGHIDRLRFEQQQGLAATMPFNSNPTGSIGWNTIDTTSLAMMFPNAPPSLDQRRGTLWGFDSRSRSPITFDPHDGTWLNMNMAIMARSGSGKSFGTKLGVLRAMTQGVRTYIIDPEGEYVDMTLHAGGRVYTPGVEGQGMNPFAVANMNAEDFYSRVGAATKLLQVMVRQPLTATLFGALDQELTTFFEDNRRIALDEESDQEQYDFHDFVTRLRDSRDEAHRELAQMLSPFTLGSMRYLLASDGADLLANETPITTFSLTSIDADMRPVAALVCADTVWAMATKDPRPRRVVVDEVWTMMQHQEGAQFMLNMSKRARKHQLGLSVITQDVQDMLAVNMNYGVSGNAGRAMLQNAQFKLLLQQDPAVLQLLIETFDLSEESARYLITAPRGSGLLICEGGHYPITIEASSEEAEIIEWTPGLHGAALAAQHSGDSDEES